MNNETRSYHTIGRLYGLSSNEAKKDTTKKELQDRKDIIKQTYDVAFASYKTNIDDLTSKLSTYSQTVKNEVGNMNKELSTLTQGFLVYVEAIRTIPDPNNQFQELIIKASNDFIDKQKLYTTQLNAIITNVNESIGGFDHQSKIQIAEDSFKKYIEMLITIENNINDLEQGYAEGQSIKLALTPTP